MRSAIHNQLVTVERRTIEVIDKLKKLKYGDIEMSNTGSVGPNKELLKAVELNNIKLFKIILDNSFVDLNYVYSKPYSGTILEICCILPQKHEFIEKLLSSGVDVNHLNEIHNNAPIHLAATSQSKKAFSLLINHPQTDINLPDGDGNTALHILSMADEMDHSQKEYRLMLLLESENINPNQLNKRGMSPAYIVAISSVKDDSLMSYYLRCSKVDLEMIVLGKPLREVIENNYPHIFPFIHLYKNDADSFISYVTSRSYSKNALESNDGLHTYLQRACSKGMTEVVQLLLDLDVNPNGCTIHNRKYPLFIAAHRGFADILQVFIDSNNPRIIYQMYENNSEKFTNVSVNYTSALHELIRNSRHKPKTNIGLCDYDRSFYLLLPIHSELDINYFDHQGSTCLHVAASVYNQNYIFSLLDNGAYIALRNNHGISLLDYINQNTLELYLNKCIKSNEQTNSNFCFEIIFSYRFLCPPKIHYNENDYGCYKHADYPNAFLKRISETYPLLCISKNPDLRPLLEHPVLSSFICLKWSKIKKYYYINLTFYMIFLAFLTAYTLFTFRSHNNFIIEPVRYILRIVVLSLFTVFFTRELFQCISFPKKYLLTLENWLEVTIIVLTSCLLSESFSKNIRPTLSVFVILTTWGEFILILGRHPMFAIPLTMLIVVTRNFLKFLLLYLILIIAFILSLFVLFSDNQDYGIDNAHASNNQTNNGHMFSNLWLTSFKTVVMLTGELEASTLPFSSENEKIGRIVVVVFIIFIPIILANLLNGLAVSEIKQINDDAEIIVLMSRLNFMNSFEKSPLSKALEIHKSRISLLARMLGIHLRLFPDVLKNQEINTIPRHRLKMVDLTKQKNSIRRMILNNRYEIDDEIVNKAMSILKLNSDIQQKCNDEKIDYLVNKLEKLFNSKNETNPS